jgi:hypothetical protein
MFVPINNTASQVIHRKNLPSFADLGAIVSGAGGSHGMRYPNRTPALHQRRARHLPG